MGSPASHPPARRAPAWLKLAFALSLGMVAVGRSRAADLAQAIRSADWPTARLAAAAYPDPIGSKLVTFYRLQHPNDASAAEIAAFLNDNPDWPDRAILLTRRDEALANEPEDATVLRLCTATPAVPAPASGAALARCAAAAAARGDGNDANAFARSAWVAGLPNAASEAQFLQRWKSVLRPADQAARFEAMLAANAPDAASQAARLGPADFLLARARLALRSNDPGADALIAALPPQQRTAPGLVLDRLRALQRANRDQDALALWKSEGFAAEAKAGAPSAAAFWSARNQLARRLLRANDAGDAYLLANDTLQSAAEPQADSAFLAGFIALRKLDRPRDAASHFADLARSRAAISQARASYWRARAAAASGDAAAAAQAYQQAAGFPTIYYGQLAILALGNDVQALDARILAAADPVWTQQQALDFAGRELTRAAAMLVAWGDPIRARPFLGQIGALADDPATRAMEAHFALGLGLPDQAVAAARLAGRNGSVLPDAGWPLAVSPPAGPVPPAVALGIIRQESSFDPGAISPAGARGLMQLMPSTARQIGAGIGQPISQATLITDADANMKLGTAYLNQLIGRFGGSLPLAIAAYNAGPNRVQEWLDQNGDPRGRGADAMIDWIELIPFAETRNYVQRVIENIAVYRAKRRETAPYPVMA